MAQAAHVIVAGRSIVLASDGGGPWVRIDGMICSSCAVVGDCSCNHRTLVAVVLAFVALKSLKGLQPNPKPKILNAQPKFNRHKPQPLSPSRSACGTLSAL